MKGICNRKDGSKRSRWLLRNKLSEKNDPSFHHIKSFGNVNRPIRSCGVMKIQDYAAQSYFIPVSNFLNYTATSRYGSCFFDKKHEEKRLLV